ncbi:MAG: M43 family zinc metalloprotease [Cytophagales bacterium]|nr:M43 family zinc metalloprotease [Cytophagales bacterium]
MRKYSLMFLVGLLWSCNDEPLLPVDDPPQDDDPTTYVIPVVVHVLHNGEAIGEGANLSVDRIERQIGILNEDFRRKTGTRGENNHPDSDDARIEFVLAKQDPDGNPSNGITRTLADLNAIPEEVPKREVDLMGYFRFWNSASYINIWTAPYDEDLANVHLGSATGPDTDLPGNHLFAKPIEGGVEGIVINHWHFGETTLVDRHNLGRTLTHEMGHYLGLLHLWGGRSCEHNDFCEDTPAVEDPVTSNTSYAGCQGEEVMIANYMNWTPDVVMNIFTKNQISRMRYVLENSEQRTSLLTSKGLQTP